MAEYEPRGITVRDVSPAAFIDVPSILIVIGGTFAITTVSFSLGEIIKGQGLMLKADRLTNGARQCVFRVVAGGFRCTGPEVASILDALKSERRAVLPGEFLITDKVPCQVADPSVISGSPPASCLG